MLAVPFGVHLQKCNIFIENATKPLDAPAGINKKARSM
jgi:hypothetical protein